MMKPSSEDRAPAERRQPSTHRHETPPSPHALFDRAPYWRSFRSGFIGDLQGARYFDEIGLEVVPLTCPLSQHGLKAHLYVLEEHGCHASWCTETSGCVQRGLSLVGTEAAMTLLLRTIGEQRTLTVPISAHTDPGCLWAVQRLIASEQAIAAMKLNDLFVQEIAATLVTAIILNDHGLSPQQVRSYEAASLDNLADRLTDTASDRDIQQAYDSLRAGVFKAVADSASRTRLVHAIVRASETIYPEPPRDISSGGDWDSFIQQVRSQNPLTNSRHRFQVCLQALSDLGRFISPPHGLSPQHWPDFFRLVLGQRPGLARDYLRFLDDAFTKHTLIRRIRGSDGTIEAEDAVFEAVAKLHILQTHFLDDPSYDPAVRIIFGDNPRQEVRAQLDGPSIYLMRLADGRPEFSSPFYISAQMGRLHETSNLRRLWQWQNWHMIWWSIKNQLHYPGTDDCRPGDVFHLSCPKAGTANCPSPTTCQGCRVHPLSISGFDPQGPYCRFSAAVRP